MATRMQSAANSLFIIFGLILVIQLLPVAAFGAGNIPAAANLEGRAFRHGDISFCLLGLVKLAAGGAAAKKLANQKPDKRHPPSSSYSHSEKLKRKFRRDPKLANTKDILFTEEDVALVYFGNYLRDMSQGLDIGALKALGPGPIINFIGIASFMSFSRGSREFEVTEERLGCYRHEEHIDNPFGYPDGEPPGSDPRELAGYDGLRGTVRPVECEVDPETGMKRYIADENGDWDTSSRFFKNSIIKCIELGRNGLVNKRSDEWEALRLLGQALHTLEDFPAHSNFIELTLIKLGYKDVFACVGENVRVEAPNGEQVPPLVTGTFGGADAMHSMLGELMDSLNQIGVTDASKKISEQGSVSVKKMRPVFEKMLAPGDDDKKDEDKDENEEEADPGLFTKLDNAREKVVDFDGEEMHKILVGLYTLHDKIARGIAGKAKLRNETGPIGTFVFATIEPLIAPLIKKVEEALLAASQAVVEGHDLNKEFSDPDFGDPSHSVLAKDHFTHLLNGPAGRMAEKMFKHVVGIVTEAWNDDSIDPKEAADRASTFMHHPFFAKEDDPMHKMMLDYVKEWLEQTDDEKDEILSRLTRQSVIDQKHNTEGLRNRSTINRDIPKSNQSQIASLGLFGLIGKGFKKVFCCCGSSTDETERGTGGDYSKLKSQRSKD